MRKLSLHLFATLFGWSHFNNMLRPWQNSCLQYMHTNSDVLFARQQINSAPMEYMQNEEQLRAELLEQLKKRELFVPNAENVPLQQLQQIYNGFIVPHPRRERRERQHLVQKLPTKCSQALPMEVQQMQRIAVVCCVASGRKRCHPSDLDSHQHQQQLLLMPKRIRMEQQP